MNSKWYSDYKPPYPAYDEMQNATGEIRDSYQALYRYLKKYDINEFYKKEKLANELFLNQGITFTVYSNSEGIERIFPFDIIPRIMKGAEWQEIEKGIKQRLKALNLFLQDVYHDQEIIKAGIIPSSIIGSCAHFNRKVVGIHVPYGIYVHISGIDLVRGEDGKFYVLEDNLRTPSGVSYVLGNREVNKRLFPELLTELKVRSVSEYPLILHKILVSLSPRQNSNPTVVLLTPGMFNSAYYEHTFLSRYMGIELVEGRDLVVDNSKVYMKTTAGLKQVDVIYRRIDDEFLDPLEFNSKSILGVAGLLNAYRKGNVAIVNALGNGVADDKAIYTYVPDMIKYYLNEDPILHNVPTYKLENPDELDYTIKNIHSLVVKKTNESGGYGLIIGSKASQQEIDDYIKEIYIHPRSFIAQPILQLSTVPCFINGTLQARHVDFRPFALNGPNGIEIIPGGLTRVALKEGSLVVNSSQGGGSKDTWILP